MEEQDEIECQPLQDVANELESNNEQENETINACLECLLVTADNCWALSKKIAALISLGSICLVIMLTLGNGPEIEPIDNTCKQGWRNVSGTCFLFAHGNCRLGCTYNYAQNTVKTWGEGSLNQGQS